MVQRKQAGGEEGGGGGSYLAALMCGNLLSRVPIRAVELRDNTHGQLVGKLGQPEATPAGGAAPLAVP